MLCLMVTTTTTILIPPQQGLDIGPESIKLITAALQDAKTVIWNGPMGVFEFDKFAAGTFAVANALAALKGGLEAFELGFCFQYGVWRQVFSTKNIC